MAAVYPFSSSFFEAIACKTPLNSIRGALALIFLARPQLQAKAKNAQTIFSKSE